MNSIYKYQIFISLIWTGLMCSNCIQIKGQSSSEYKFELENFHCELTLQQKNDTTILLELEMINKTNGSIYFLIKDLDNFGHYQDKKYVDINLDFWITDPMLAPWMYLDLIEAKPNEPIIFRRHKIGTASEIEEVIIHGCQIIVSQIENKKIRKKLEKSIKRKQPKIWIRYFYTEWNPNSFGHKVELNK